MFLGVKGEILRGEKPRRKGIDEKGQSTRG